MIDSHCHLDFDALADDLRPLLQDARAAGVEGWLVPGCDPSQWRRLRRLKKQHDEDFWFAVGVHPWWVHQNGSVASEEADDGPQERQLLKPEDVAVVLERAAQDMEVVAIGECGLDSKGAPAGVPEQLPVFEAQLAVAKDLRAPLVLHQVGAEQQFLQCLDRVGLSATGGVVHGFSGDLDWARTLLERGLYLGVGVAATRPNRKRLREALTELPLERLLLETDAPDQAPHGSRRGQGKPVHLRDVCRALAELRGQPVDAVERVTAANTRQLFGL